MNEQASMMNQHQQQQQMMNPQPMRSAPPQLMNQQQTQPQMLMNPPQPQLPPPQMMNRSYGMWGPPPQAMDLQLKFQNPNRMKGQGRGGGGGFVAGVGKPAKHPLGPRNNWKGKKVDKRKNLGRRMENPLSLGGGSTSSEGVMNIGVVAGNVGIGGGYKPPTLNELQHQNRVKARRFFPKKNYNSSNNNSNNNNNRNNYNRGKFAPRNTTSYLIRAKKSGGIAELVSPCPVTPAVLPTPIFSPSREVLVDMAKEEWGVDGYGSMKGLIRLRSPGNEGVEGHEDEEEDEGGSSESDVEEHVEVERRLDHDLSRFEMIYPNYGTVGGMEFNNLLENRVDDQDSHIAQLEEENLILKERLFLMERELGDLRRRLQSLERHSLGGEEINEEVVENESENESENRGGAQSIEDNNEDMAEDNVEVDMDAKGEEENTLDVFDEASKSEEHIAEYRGEEEKKGGIKVNNVKVNEQGTKNDGYIAENRGQEEKDEIEANHVEVNEPNNNHLKVKAVIYDNDSVEAPENTPVGGDVCMDEVAHTREGFVEEKQSKQEAAGGAGLEKSIGEGDFN